MGKLNSGNRTLAFDETCNSLQRPDLRVAPEAEIARRYTAFGQDRRCFNHDVARTADRSASQMDQVPVIGETVLS